MIVEPSDQLKLAITVRNLVEIPEEEPTEFSLIEHQKCASMIEIK